MDAVDTPASTETEVPQQQDSIASLMAKEGTKSNAEGDFYNPVNINKISEPNSSKSDSPVAPTNESNNSEYGDDVEVLSVNTLYDDDDSQTENNSNQYNNWEESIKSQQPQAILKALGYDDSAISFIQGLQGIDPKMVGFLNTWKEGGNVQEYLQEASKDYSQMPAEEVMRHQLRNEYPKASEAQLDVLYKKEIVEKYNLGSFDDDEANEGKLLLEAKADKYRDGLIESQKQKILPSGSQYSESQRQQQEEVEKLTQSVINSFQENPYTKEVLSKNSITFGEGNEKFTFPIDAKAVTDLAINGDVNGDLMFDKIQKDGEETYVPKAQHQMLVATVNKYGEKFITELAKHYKSLGSKAAIEPIENARPIENRSSSNATQEPTSVAGAMAKYGQLQSGGW
jgi:hypothetical protein